MSLWPSYTCVSSPDITYIPGEDANLHTNCLPTQGQDPIELTQATSLDELAALPENILAASCMCSSLSIRTVP